MGCGTLVALGLMGAGLGASEGASVMEGRAMNSKAQNELARQRAYQHRGMGVFNQSLGQSTPQAAQQQIGQGQRQALQSSQMSALPLMALPSAPNEPFSSVANAASGAESNRAIGSNAALQGYSNYGLQQYLKDLSAGSQLGLISNQAQQSENVLPVELQQASQSQQGLSSLGQLLSAAGMLTGIGSMTGAFGAAPLANAPTAGTYFGAPYGAGTGGPLPGGMWDMSF
jgi:hypothetical protein